MRYRNTGVSRRGYRRGHARHNLERYARVPALFRLFPTPPEDKRVAALEPRHRFALSGPIKQERIDIRLFHGVLRAGFADIDFFSVRTRMV